MVFGLIQKQMTAVSKMIGSSLFLRSLCRNCLKINHIPKRLISSSQNVDFDKGNQYDIIIAGGGMVGCTLACTLAKNPKLASQRILLLEGSPEQKFTLKEEFSNRVTALNHNTKKLMTSIGAWKHIEQMRCQAVKNMQVWDASSDAMITFNHDNLQGDVAFIVENDVLLHAVNTEISSPDVHNEVNVIYSAKIADYKLANSDREKAIVKMENGDTYSCRLLLGADGANSKVRAKMGVQYLSWAYNQMGVVATIELAEETVNTTAWQRFLPSGPVALLPLGPRHSSLVWTTSSQDAKRLLQIPQQEFMDCLTHALHHQYPRNSVVDGALGALSTLLGAPGARQLPPALACASQRAAFPLAFGHASRYVGHNVALIGDAAHRVHPLAGQGVNLGFGDVSDLVRILAEAVYSGEQLGQKSQLLKYETIRQRHVFPTAVGIDGLQKLYSFNNTPTILLRSLGLQITHSLAPLKKAIMNHAMG